MSKIKIFISSLIIIFFIGCNSTKKYDEQTNHLDRATYKLKLRKKANDIYLTFFEDKTYTIRLVDKIKKKGKWKQLDSIRVLLYNTRKRYQKFKDTVIYTEEKAQYRGVLFKRYDSIPLWEKIYK